MKTLIFFIGVMFTLLSYAEDIKIYELSLGDARLTQELSFVANVDQPELGRAWVKLVVDDNDPEWGDDELEFKVHGRAYDASSGMIFFQSKTGRVDCASVVQKGRGIFSRTIIQPTGNCEFFSRKVVRSEDTGFRVMKRTVMEFYLSVE